MLEFFKARIEKRKEELRKEELRQAQLKQESEKQEQVRLDEFSLLENEINGTCESFYNVEKQKLLRGNEENTDSKHFFIFTEVRKGVELLSEVTDFNNGHQVTFVFTSCEKAKSVEIVEGFKGINMREILGINALVDNIKLFSLNPELYISFENNNHVSQETFFGLAKLFVDRTFVAIRTDNNELVTIGIEGTTKQICFVFSNKTYGVSKLESLGLKTVQFKLDEIDRNTFISPIFSNITNCVIYAEGVRFRLEDFMYVESFFIGR